MGDEHTRNTQSPQDAGYEKQDVKPVWIFAITLLTIAFLVVAGVILYEYFTVYKEAVVEEQVLTPQSTALRDLRAHEAEVLNSYKLLNADSGVYQIPIDRAMELVADEAFQARQEKTGQNK
jgi:hypothetical protein